MCLLTYPIMRRATVGAERCCKGARPPRGKVSGAGRTTISGLEPPPGRRWVHRREDVRRTVPTHHEEVSMAKKSRKKKARKKNAANHGKRPNS